MLTGHSAGYVLVLMVSDISSSDSCTGSGLSRVLFDQRDPSVTLPGLSGARRVFGDAGEGRVGLWGWISRQSTAGVLSGGPT